MLTLRHGCLLRGSPNPRPFEKRVKTGFPQLELAETVFHPDCPRKATGQVRQMLGDFGPILGRNKRQVRIIGRRRVQSRKCAVRPAISEPMHLENMRARYQTMAMTAADGTQAAALVMKIPSTEPDFVASRRPLRLRARAFEGALRWLARFALPCSEIWVRDGDGPRHGCLQGIGYKKKENPGPKR